MNLYSLLGLGTLKQCRKCYPTYDKVALQLLVVPLVDAGLTPESDFVVSLRLQPGLLVLLELLDLPVGVLRFPLILTVPKRDCN